MLLSPQLVFIIVLGITVVLLCALTQLRNRRTAGKETTKKALAHTVVGSNSTEIDAMIPQKMESAIK
jgi:hypothetical protein